MDQVPQLNLDHLGTPLLALSLGIEVVL